MSLRSRLVLLLALAVVLGVFVWWRHGESASRPETSARSASDAAGSPALRGRSDATAEAQPGVGREEEPARKGLHVLRLTVSGARGVEGEARVRVLGLSATLRETPPPEVHAAVVVGETVAIDVSALLGTEPPVDQLHVLVDHPQCFPGEGRVPLPSGYAAAERPDPLELGVHLVPAAVLDGVVVDEEGRGIEGASIRTEGHGSTPWPPTPQRVLTDAGGRYRVRREEGRYHVVAWREGRRPAALEIEARTGEATTVPDLVLGDGAAIAGVVRVNGGPVEGATVVCARTPIAPGAMPLEEPLLHEGVVEWGGRVVRSGEQGRFEIRGLAPERWHLRVHALPGAVLYPGVSRRTQRAVDAPASGVGMDVVAARLGVRFEGPEDLPSGIRATLSVEDDLDGAWIRRGEDALFFVEPRSRGVIHAVTEEVWRADPVEVVAPDAGEETDVVLVLEPTQRSGATVTVRFLGGQEVPLERVFVGLYRDEESFPRKRWEQRPVEGTATLHHVPAGTWRLRAKPGGYATDIDTWYVPFDRTLDLVDGGEAEVDVPLVEGGRVRLRVRDPDGADRPANWRLTDGRGREVADWAWAVSPEGRGAGGRKGGMPDQQPGVLDPPVPPGRYVLEVTLDGFLPERREVEVSPRAYADVEVTLRPAPSSR